MFSVRAVSLDYYIAKTNRAFYQNRNDEGDGEVPETVIRIFGSTDEGD